MTTPKKKKKKKSIEKEKKRRQHPPEISIKMVTSKLPGESVPNCRYCQALASGVLTNSEQLSPSQASEQFTFELLVSPHLASASPCTAASSGQEGNPVGVVLFPIGAGVKVHLVNWIRYCQVSSVE